MTDQELLEQAAKAAGYEVAEYYNNVGGIWCQTLDRRWDPLGDDADAFRLAVALNVELAINPGKKATRVYVKQQLGDFGITEQHDGNPLAATRRAIVRAAAAMTGDV